METKLRCEYKGQVVRKFRAILETVPNMLVGMVVRGREKEWN